MLTGLAQEHFESICQLRMKGMVSDVRTSREQPSWIGDTLWKQMTAYWDTEAAVGKSRKASAARLSERNGLGIHKHNSGHKSYMQIEQELVSIIFFVSFSLTLVSFSCVSFFHFISDSGVGKTCEFW